MISPPHTKKVHGSPTKLNHNITEFNHNKSRYRLPALTLSPIKKTQLNNLINSSSNEYLFTNSYLNNGNNRQIRKLHTLNSQLSIKNIKTFDNTQKQNTMQHNSNDVSSIQRIPSTQLINKYVQKLQKASTEQSIGFKPSSGDKPNNLVYDQSCDIQSLPNIEHKLETEKQVTSTFKLSSFKKIRNILQHQNPSKRNSIESSSDGSLLEHDEFDIWDNSELKILGINVEQLNIVNKTERILKLFKIRYGQFPLQREHIENDKVIKCVKKIARQNTKLYREYFQTKEPVRFNDTSDYSKQANIYEDDNYKKFINYKLAYA